MSGKEKVLFMKGNEAIIYAAIKSGCRCFFGYPITPSSEALEEAVRSIPKIGGVGLQMESEAAASFACYGAATAGERVITVTSGPGMTWMQDAICYMALAELPCVFVNMMRAGPALGSLSPSQSDYFQAVKGGGNGDYQSIVLAPSSVQELVDFTKLSFELADKYRTPVIILGDGMLGQMKETFIPFAPVENLPQKDWKIDERKNGFSNMFIPFNLDPKKLEVMNLKLQEKYTLIKNSEVQYEYEAIDTEQSDLLIVAFGSMARIVKTAIEEVRMCGINASLLRPITLWPFPSVAIKNAASSVKNVLVVEMNYGQMLEDVERAVCGVAPVHFYGRAGGMIPTVDEILFAIKSLVQKKEE